MSKPSKPSQLPKSPISQADISEYLQTVDSFQFEMEVLRLCQAHGLKAKHGGTYQDPISDKDRQFDVRAVIANQARVLRMAIECKKLSEHNPLLISRVPRLRDESFHDVLSLRDPSRPGSYTLAPEAFDHTAHAIYHKRVYHTETNFEPDQPVGKATTQVSRISNSQNFNASDGEVSDRWRQAIASSYDLLEESFFDYALTGKGYAHVRIQPILVVADRTLWVADYTADGKQVRQPERVDECTLYLEKTLESKLNQQTKVSYKYVVSHLCVYTRTGFEAFVKGLSTESCWSEMFRPVFNS